MEFHPSNSQYNASTGVSNNHPWSNDHPQLRGSEHKGSVKVTSPIKWAHVCFIRVESGGLREREGCGLERELVSAIEVYPSSCTLCFWSADACIAAVKDVLFVGDMQVPIKFPVECPQ